MSTFNNITVEWIVPISMPLLWLITNSGEAEVRCGPSVVSSIRAVGNGIMHSPCEEAISLEAVSFFFFFFFGIFNIYTMFHFFNKFIFHWCSICQHIE